MSGRIAVIKRYRYVGKHAYVHRLRAEKALGKPLPPRAEVHHADGSTSEFAPLVICQDHAYHALLHARMRIVRAGGNPNTQRICAKCKRLKFIEEMAKLKPDSRRGPIHNTCKACNAVSAGARYLRMNPEERRAFNKAKYAKYGRAAYEASKV